jgi:hypothetical protein
MRRGFPICIGPLSDHHHQPLQTVPSRVQRARTMKVRENTKRESGESTERLCGGNLNVEITTRELRKSTFPPHSQARRSLTAKSVPIASSVAIFETIIARWELGKIMKKSSVFPSDFFSS